MVKILDPFDRISHPGKQLGDDRESLTQALDYDGQMVGRECFKRPLYPRRFVTFDVDLHQRDSSVLLRANLVDGGNRDLRLARRSVGRSRETVLIRLGNTSGQARDIVEGKL